MVIRVINSGALSAKIEERLFKEGVTTKGTEGHGIGLRISTSLAQANQGTLAYEKTPEGVCFKVQLPKVNTAAVKSQTA